MEGVGLRLSEKVSSLERQMKVVIKIRKKPPYDVEVDWEPKEAFGDTVEQSLKDMAKYLYRVRKDRFYLEWYLIQWAQIYMAAKCTISLEGDIIVVTFTPVEGREDWFMEMINHGKWGEVLC